MSTKPVRIVSFGIGHEGPIYQGKFIVAEAFNSLDVYGGPVRFHHVLTTIDGIKSEKVLGGARYTFAYGSLTLFDTSDVFGSVHSGVREEISRGLVTHLTEKGFSVTSTDVSGLKDVKKEDMSKERNNVKKWEAAGFPVLS
jgi:hypothetical protein